MSRTRHLVMLLVLAVSALVMVACVTGPAAEKPATTASDARSEAETSSGTPTGDEATVSRADRTTTTGIITEIQRTRTGKGIVVEEHPYVDCRSPNKPSCEKMYYEILHDTRVVRDEGCDQRAVEEASAADLKKGHKVRADHTGYEVWDTYPGQTTALSIAICAEGLANTTPVLPSDAGIFFAELKKPQSTPLLGVLGKLFLDRKGCLRVNDPTLDSDDPGYVPVWLPQYKPDLEDDVVRILDRKGRVVARVGEGVFLGGGEIDTATLEEYNFMDERHLQELSERCPGRYWLVSDDGVEIRGED
jgi:hypothetical protein